MVTSFKSKSSLLQDHYETTPSYSRLSYEYSRRNEYQVFLALCDGFKGTERKEKDEHGKRLSVVMMTSFFFFGHWKKVKGKKNEECISFSFLFLGSGTGTHVEFMLRKTH